MKKRVLVLAMIAALGLAGCGGDDDNGSDETGASSGGTENGTGAGSQGPDQSGGSGSETGAPPPTPDPDPEGPPPALGGTGTDCMDPAWLAAGATYGLDYDISGLLTGTSISEARVIGRTDFAGYSAFETEVTTTTTYTGLPPAQTAVKSYSDSLGGGLLEQYGNTSAADVMGMTSTTVTTYVPPWRMTKWTLSAGQSEPYSYEFSTETTITGAPVAIPPQITTGTESGTWTYEGQESVTVPLGTFQACRFRTESGGSVITEWYDLKSKSGLALKITTVSTEGTLVMEMTRGELNGQPLTP